MERRTDLALEVRESFPGDDVEVSGVVLEEENYLDGRIRLTILSIKNEKGQEQMRKPIGNYITLELRRENMMMTMNGKRQRRPLK